MPRKHRRESYLSKVVVPPQALAGFLKKQGHIFKTWKRRYFVLDAGRLTYYKSATEEGFTRTGMTLLGSMPLTGVELQIDDHTSQAWEDAGRIYINDVVTGVDLMLQIPTDVFHMWKEGLEQHVDFASRSPDMVASVPESHDAPWRLSLMSAFSPTNEVRKSFVARCSLASSASTSESLSSAQTRSTSTSSTEKAAEYATAISELCIEEEDEDTTTVPDQRRHNPNKLANIKQIWSYRTLMEKDTTLLDSASTYQHVHDPVAPGGHIGDTAAVQASHGSRRRNSLQNDPSTSIAFTVDRPTGVAVHADFDADSEILSRIPYQSIVLVIGRRLGPDNLAWYRVMNGWVVAYSDFGQRMIKHTTLGHPLGTKVVKMNFIERPNTGWFGPSQTFQTEFILEFQHNRQSLVHLRRSFEQVRDLQLQLGEVDRRLRWDTYKTVTDDVMPVHEDGLDTLLDDPDVSIQLRDVIEKWLNMAIHVKRLYDECPLMNEFLRPTEDDCYIMDMELMAFRGLKGSFPGKRLSVAMEQAHSLPAPGYTGI